MTVLMQILLAAGSVLALLGVMMVIRHLAKAAGLNAEVQRKLMHVSTGLFALLLPWIFSDRWPVYMLIAATMLVMLVLRLPRFSKGLGATLHGVERTSYGDFLLALSVGLCFLLAGNNLLFYILPIAVLTLADAAAALAGTAYGTRRFIVEDGEKSVEGSVVFFVVTMLIAIVCFLFMTALPPANTLMLCIMVAAFGTLVEAQSWRGFDNLFLPLGLLIFLSVHFDSSLIELATIALVFLASLSGFSILGARLGLTKHATRVYVITVFLLLAVTALQNAVLPILVLATHLWARVSTTCDSKYPDLDVVASLGLFSFGWLALGNATGWNAVSFYGLSAMGLAMGFSVLALQGKILAILAVATALFLIRHFAVALNPEPARWAEPLTILALLSLICMTVVPWIRPQWFEKDRVLRLTVLALAPPLIYYAYSVAGSIGAGFFAGVAS
ncbi:hypothetical protein [Ruegeria atlantica]|uniref:hypothetical protein n=1 Tax=Ruegeria atlantica TaxID=81569 RepID=UPI00147B7235|nr:hypothetical protein [Ruegeria atlantica]